MMMIIIDFLDLAQIRDSQNLHLTSGALPTGYILQIKFGQKIRLNQPGDTSRNRGKRGHSPARVFRLWLNFANLAVLAVFHVCRHGHHYDQKSSYVEIGQLIGNAPGGATNQIDALISESRIPAIARIGCDTLSTSKRSPRLTSSICSRCDRLQMADIQSYPKRTGT